MESKDSCKQFDIPCDIEDLSGEYANDLILLTMSSENVTDSEMLYFINSCKRFNYPFKILDRNKPWTGFKTRTNRYIEELSKSDVKYAILADCIDLFFCRDAGEFLDRIKKEDTVICGSEKRGWCPWSNYSLRHMTIFFKSVSEEYKSDVKFPGLCFPNAGFMAGERLKLIEVLKEMREYEDDQTGLYETLLEGRAEVKQDYDVLYVGNCKRVGTTGDDIVDHDSWMVEGGEVVSVYGHKPVCMHFHSRNLVVMREFYDKVMESGDGK